MRRAYQGSAVGGKRSSFEIDHHSGAGLLEEAPRMLHAGSLWRRTALISTLSLRPPHVVPPAPAASPLADFDTGRIVDVTLEVHKAQLGLLFVLRVTHVHAARHGQAPTNSLGHVFQVFPFPFPMNVRERQIPCVSLHVLPSFARTTQLPKGVVVRYHEDKYIFPSGAIHSAKVCHFAP